MSYSIEDALDREAMQSLHDALLAADACVMALRARGFTIRLQLVSDELENGKTVKKFRAFKDSWNSEVDGKLSACVTKSYNLPYGAGAK